MDYNNQNIEQIRLQEATTKELVGADSKLVYIVKILGSEIIQDNFIDNSIISFYEDLESENDDNINTFSDDHTSTIIGYTFDTLRYGIPLEIIYKENLGSMKVFWNNRCVFEEYHGTLERYVPLLEWENKIDEFYSKAKERLKAKKESQQLKQNKVRNTAEDIEVQKIKEKWGII